MLFKVLLTLCAVLYGFGKDADSISLAYSQGITRKDGTVLTARRIAGKRGRVLTTSRQLGVIIRRRTFPRRGGREFEEKDQPSLGAQGRKRRGDGSAQGGGGRVGR